MRLSIWAFDANPAIDPRLLKRSFSDCEKSVAVGELRWIDPKDKSKGCLTSPPAGYTAAGEDDFSDGPLGVGNLLPFNRVQKHIGVDGAYLYLAPEKIRYPIPACGARSRPQWVKQINALPAEPSVS